MFAQKNFFISIIFCTIFLILGLFVFSSECFAAMSFNLDGIKGNPVTISFDQEVEALVSFNDIEEEKSYYLQGVFKHSSGTYYFGYTWSNDAWHKYGEDFENFYKVDIKESSWSGKLRVKPDPEAGGFKGTGEYIFKAFRYCSTQSRCGETQELTLNIQAPPSPTPSPTPTPSPSPSLSPETSPTPSPSLSPLSSPTATSQAQVKKEKQEAFDKETALSAEVLGTTESPEPTKKPEEKQENKKGSLGKLPFVLIGGGIILLFGANFQTLKPKIQDIIELIKYKVKT